VSPDLHILILIIIIIIVKNTELDRRSVRTNHYSDGRLRTVCARTVGDYYLESESNVVMGRPMNDSESAIVFERFNKKKKKPSKNVVKSAAFVKPIHTHSRFRCIRSESNVRTGNPICARRVRIDESSVIHKHLFGRVRFVANSKFNKRVFQTSLTQYACDPPPPDRITRILKLILHERTRRRRSRAHFVFRTSCRP